MRKSPAQIAEAIVLSLPDACASTAVALDGRSGSGKSTVAAELLERLNPTGSVTLVEGDSFYTGGTAFTWDHRTIAESVASAFDWRRQRKVLQTLKRGEVARWRSFDWLAPNWATDDPPLEEHLRSVSPAEVIVLEGVYCARPELADLVDLRVLLSVREDVRLEQLIEREGEGMNHGWERRWSQVEDYYFSRVMTPSEFDLVIAADDDGDSDPP